MTFRYYSAPTGKAAEIVGLGDDYRYDVLKSTVELTADRSPEKDLAQYTVSSEIMRDEGLAKMQALQAKVDGTIRSHQVTTCDYGPYLGKGIPPQCTPRPPTEKEEAAELVRADAYFAGQEQAMRDQYQEMFASWLKAFPVDRCSP